MEKILARPVVHAPIREDDGCADCHGPHVGYGSALQKKDGVETCLECHDGPEFTGEYQHEIAFEDCATCHEVHAGENPRLLITADVMEMCLTCHSDAPETHYHPMGEGVIDPRTQEALNCVGCHSPHSSDYQALLVADKDRKLCTNCHALAH
jgi:predicted CXXCH cytochrome family protein